MHFIKHMLVKNAIIMQDSRHDRVKENSILFTVIIFRKCYRLVYSLCIIMYIIVFIIINTIMNVDCTVHLIAQI